MRTTNCFHEVMVTGYGKKEWKGTIEVRLLGIKKEDALLRHVRIITPSASKEVGIYCLPEINEIGYIMFVDEMFTQAIYVGSLIPLESDITKKLEEDNSLKLIYTTSGYKLEIHEQKDKEKICFISKSGLEISMEEENQVLTFGQSDQKQQILIDMKNKSICILGEEKLEMKCKDAAIVLEKGNITLKGSNITTNCDVCTVDTKKELKLKSVNATLSATNKATVHGSMCEVSADSKLDVKGAMIQIG